MSNIGINLKFLRRKHNLTQGQFAEKVGVNRPAVGAYEEGRAEPKISTLNKISEVFEVSVDSLINHVLEQIPVEEFKSKTQDISGKRLRVLSVSTNEEDEENVELVGQKASAGYTNGYADPEFIQELPKLYLPMLSGGTHRAFEIKGDSMLPVQPGSVIVGEYVDNWHEIKSGKTYIVITENEGIVFKRVTNLIYEKGTLLLKSDNTAYSEYEVSIEDVKEVWKASTLITSQFPEPASDKSSVEHLTKMLFDLQQEVVKIKGQMK